MGDEGRRFLRYVMPGLVYGVETLLFLYIVMPKFTICILAKLIHMNALGALGGVFLVSAALGYIFAAVHHWVHWHFPVNNDDNLELGARETAMSDSLALWYSLLNKKHKLGTDGINQLLNQAHALGTARIASCFALVTTIVVLNCVVVLHGTINLSCWSIFRLIVMPILSICTIWIFTESYRRVDRFAENAFNKTLKMLRTEHVPPPSDTSADRNRPCLAS